MSGGKKIVEGLRQAAAYTMGLEARRAECDGLRAENARLRAENERLRQDLAGAHGAADWNAKVVAERDAEIARLIGDVDRLAQEILRLKRASALEAIAETDGKLLD